MIETIREAWGWIGLDPLRVETTNAFGNVIVEDTQGRFWRIRPEDLACAIIASNREEYTALWANPDFVRGLEMARLVQEAKHRLGPIPTGSCYCLKMPSVLGGKYDVDNLGTVDHSHLIAFSGYLAEQIKDMPDGSQVILKIVD